MYYLIISVIRFVLVNELYAWGYNKFGQLGTGDTINRLTPQLVGFFNDKKLKKIDAGEYHSLALTGKYLLFN